MKEKTEFRKKRDEFGLSQSQAAKVMNRPLSTVVKWDGGFSSCSKNRINEFSLLFEDAKKSGRLAEIIA